MDSIFHIAILYGIFLAMPFRFCVLYVVFKTSERVKGGDLQGGNEKECESVDLKGSTV